VLSAQTQEQRGHVTALQSTWMLPAKLSGSYRLDVTVYHADTLIGTSQLWPMKVENVAFQLAPSCSEELMKNGAGVSIPGTDMKIFSYSGCSSTSRRYNLTGGLSAAPDAILPFIQYGTAQSQLRAGLVSLGLDPFAIDGVDGRGVVYQRSWDPTRSLLVAWLRPKSFPASLQTAQYTIRSAATSLNFTAGHESTAFSPDPYALATWGIGNFAAVSFAWQPQRTHDAFGVRFATVDYEDANRQARHFDRALEAFATIALGSTSWTMNERRTGPFYLMPSAPSLLSDRDAQTLSGSFSLGKSRQPSLLLGIATICRARTFCSERQTGWRSRRFRSPSAKMSPD